MSERATGAGEGPTPVDRFTPNLCNSLGLQFPHLDSKDNTSFRFIDNIHNSTSFEFCLSLVKKAQKALFAERSLPGLMNFKFFPLSFQTE